MSREGNEICPVLWLRRQTELNSTRETRTDINAMLSLQAKRQLILSIRYKAHRQTLLGEETSIALACHEADTPTVARCHPVLT
jgi:hypothetical protein